MSTSETAAANRFSRSGARTGIGAGSLAPVLDELAPRQDHVWAWGNYKRSIETFSRRLGLSRLCEIGGGRNPLFSPAEAVALGARLTVNDISADELGQLPEAYGRACFDIADSEAVERFGGGRFDLMFSRMVFEHVRDTGQAWHNVRSLLAPGGVCLAFFPTLYCLPFAINRMIPERASAAIVKALYRHRDAQGLMPKFPAFYDNCVSREERLLPLLSRAGFREAAVLPFWGHDYFERLPLLREADALFNRLAARRGLRLVTSYAYVIVRK